MENIDYSDYNVRIPKANEQLVKLATRLGIESDIYGNYDIFKLMNAFLDEIAKDK